MEQYSTGELAKLCGVSVRTVQFYDTKDLLHPSTLTEGGRRLYTQGDASRLRLICLLKSFGLSLDSIRGILESEAPEKVLSTLLEEQTGQIAAQIKELQTRKETLETIQKSIQRGQIASVDALYDATQQISGNRRLRRTHAKMLLYGCLMQVAEITTILIWILRGVWWPFAAVMPLVLAAAVLVMRMYYREVDYICPDCGTRFKPARKQFIFADHTYKTRKLTCTHCGYAGYCVETAAEESGKKQK